MARTQATNRKNTAKGKKINLGIIIIAIILIIAIVVLGIVYKDTIINIINKPAPTGTSVLGGHATVTMPTEIGKVGLEVHFVDVGQGDAIIIRLPDGKDMLVDAGSGTSEKKAVTESYIAYLNSIDIGKIDYMLATHAHSDHMNMLDNVLENFEVSNIYYNGYDNESAPTTAYYKDFEQKAAAEKANVVKFDGDGDVYEIASDKGVSAELTYSVKIYAPGFSRYDKETNYMSPFVVVEYADRKVLLTGDAEATSEKWFIEKIGGDSLDIDVLKVGHHGSTEGTSKEFLSFIKTEFAVISVGENNTYNHPTPFTMNDLYNRGIVTYRTNRQGNIVLYLDTDGDFAFGVKNTVPVDNNKNLINDKMIIPTKAA